MNEFCRRLRMLLRRDRFERDLEDEIAFHLDMKARENREAGSDAEEARYAARRQFGNATLLRENSREVWGWRRLERLCQDLGYALRVFRRAPGFTAAAVLSLALGIGANTAIFSALNALILRPLPVPRPHELVQFTNSLPLWETGASGRNSLFSYPQLERFQAGSKTVAGVFGGTRLGRVNIGFRHAPAIAIAEAYTGNFFSVLGIAPQYGRFFSVDDDRADAAVAVVSDRYWRSRFAADPAAIGEPMTINRIPFTVIGVAPPEFSGISAGTGPDIWMPLRALDRLRPDKQRWTEFFTSWLTIAARLRPGVSRERAQAELDVTYREVLGEHASDLAGLDNVRRFVRANHLLLEPAASGTASGLRDRYTLPLLLLMSIAGLVLLVACANVANLQLARASGRRREIAVRLALGAGRGRIVRQLLTESIALACAGGALGLLLAVWGSRALVAAISGSGALSLDVNPDWRVFGFTAAVALLTGVLFGLAPAVRGTRVDPGAAMKEGTRSAAPAAGVTGRLLVMAQVALSVVLVTGAGLFVRTLQNLRSVDLGFERENVLMFSVDARLAGYDEDRSGPLYRDILQKLETLPGVRSASASVVRPIDDSFHLADQVGEIDGRVLPPSEAVRVVWNSVSPGYFATMSTSILLGRDFDALDVQNAPPVVIVNESLAARVLPGRNPIGRRLGAATIIGVARDSHYAGARDRPRSALYYPLFQHGAAQEFRWGFVSFELRYRNEAGLADAARRAVASVDATLPVFRMNTLQAQAEESLLRERLLAMLSSFFAGLVLLLACVGVYGLLAYTVARRRGEIGIRMALGAGRERVVVLVLRDALLLALGGIAAGIPLALWAARYTRSVLFGIGAADPAVMAVTITALLLVTMLAGWLPARRAAKIDPIEALRYE